MDNIENKKEQQNNEVVKKPSKVSPLAVAAFSAASFFMGGEAVENVYGQGRNMRIPSAQSDTVKISHDDIVATFSFALLEASSAKTVAEYNAKVQPAYQQAIANCGQDGKLTQEIREMYMDAVKEWRTKQATVQNTPSRVVDSQQSTTAQSTPTQSTQVLHLRPNPSYPRPVTVKETASKAEVIAAFTLAIKNATAAGDKSKVYEIFFQAANDYSNGNINRSGRKEYDGIGSEIAKITNAAYKEIESRGQPKIVTTLPPQTTIYSQLYPQPQTTVYSQQNVHTTISSDEHNRIHATFLREMQRASRANSRAAHGQIIQNAYNQAVRNAKGNTFTINQLNEMRDSAMQDAEQLWPTNRLRTNQVRTITMPPGERLPELRNLPPPIIFNQDPFRPQRGENIYDR